MTENGIYQINPITLAFVGDAEFSLYVRRTLTVGHDYKAAELTRRANRAVSAVAQSKMFEANEKTLTERETEIARRARDAHTPSHAKNAALSEYKRATALEAVFGYLSLLGDRDRLDGLMEQCLRVDG